MINECRCGKPADFEISLSAGEPFDPLSERTKTHLLMLTVRSCRVCAFAAAQLVLGFLDPKDRPS